MNGGAYIHVHVQGMNSRSGGAMKYEIMKIVGRLCFGRPTMSIRAQGFSRSPNLSAPELIFARLACVQFVLVRKTTTFRDERPMQVKYLERQAKV